MLEVIKTVSMPETTVTTESPSQSSNTNSADIAVAKMDKYEDSANTGSLSSLDEKKLEQVAQAMDSHVSSMQRDLKIRVHEESGRVVVQVTGEDGEVIREIPPEEFLTNSSLSESQNSSMIKSLIG